MKLATAFVNLLKKHSITEMISAFLQVVPWDRFLLHLSNRCIGLAYQAKGKAKKRAWTHQARLFHRVYDELNLEKAGKTVFKVTRRDIYTCKCKKRFLVDPGRDKNCKFDLDQSALVVTCPHCGKSEQTKVA